MIKSIFVWQSLDFSRSIYFWNRKPYWMGKISFEEEMSQSQSIFQVFCEKYDVILIKISFLIFCLFPESSAGP